MTADKESIIREAVRVVDRSLPAPREANAIELHSTAYEYAEEEFAEAHAFTFVRSASGRSRNRPSNRSIKAVVSGIGMHNESLHHPSRVKAVTAMTLSHDGQETWSSANTRVEILSSPSSRVSSHSLDHSPLCDPDADGYDESYEDNLQHSFEGLRQSR